MTAMQWGRETTTDSTLYAVHLQFSVFVLGSDDAHAVAGVLVGVALITAELKGLPSAQTLR